MEKTLRTCTICGTTAQNLNELNNFVTDKKKEKFYFTKATCKKCNANIAKQKRAGTYIYKDKTTKCRDCGIKPKDSKELESLFVKDKTMKTGYANLCRRCASARTIKHQKDKPDMFKIRQRKYAVSQHNLSLEKYNEILASQGYSCAICKVNHLEVKRSLYIDHDHSCCPGKTSCGACIRGLLCTQCNFMIGLSRDSIDNLKHAIMYLTKGVQN